MTFCYFCVSGKARKREEGKRETEKEGKNRKIEAGREVSNSKTKGSPA